MNMAAKFATRVALGLAIIVSSSGMSYAASKSECRAYAKHQANKKAGAQQILPGMAVGALGGLLVGGLIDGKQGARRGALIGGIGGTVVGGAAAEKKWKKVYNQAYAACRAD